ncbi:MAG TPA: hypothetical protein VNK46_10345 [Nitrospiraceae bacterium]|jgi:hypothetical protein|nr:hypothetical protein [Nitrospiraceae bacterium]
MKGWSRVAALACVLAGSGCADGAKVIQETETGGIVVYPFNSGQGHLVSPFRRDALQLIVQRCGSQYTIVREGEAKGRSRIAGGMGGTEDVVHERRWGIQFECK